MLSGKLFTDGHKNLTPMYNKITIIFVKCFKMCHVGCILNNLLKEIAYYITHTQLIVQEILNGFKPCDTVLQETQPNTINKRKHMYV